MCWRLSGPRGSRRGRSRDLVLDQDRHHTLGNRQATALLPVRGVTSRNRDCSAACSHRRRTPEGRSIVVIAKEKYGYTGSLNGGTQRHRYYVYRANNVMSGVDAGRRPSQGRGSRRSELRSEAGRKRVPRGRMENTVRALQPSIKSETAREREIQANRTNRKMGGTRLASRDARLLGVGSSRISQGRTSANACRLRTNGHPHVMTRRQPGDGGAICAEAGVDDFLAQARRRIKLS